MNEPQRQKDVDLLCAELREKLPRVMIALAAKDLPGVRFVVFETLRTVERQHWLFTSPERGGPHLTSMDGFVKIGKHQRGEAVDIAALDAHGHFLRDDHAAWKAIAAIGEDEGLRSGRSWYDWPHLETKRREA